MDSSERRKLTSLKNEKKFNQNTSYASYICRYYFSN